MPPFPLSDPTPQHATLMKQLLWFAVTVSCFPLRILLPHLIWQVLRYDHTASSIPLWASACRRPSAVPPCPRCGSARWFEFQLLPQVVWQ